jgi:predicted lipoprotein with Yx(FWY)xxD motif
MNKRNASTSQSLDSTDSTKGVAPMTRIRFSVAGVVLVIVAIVAVLVATSGGRANTVQRTASATSGISLHQTPLGKALVDAHGRTLYLFEGDRSNVSTLSAAGRAVWPPFTSNSRPQALGGVVAADIGTIKQSGGGFQVTYAGHPLYYFIGDRGPGQTRGQGLNEFGALWYVLASNGAAITSAPRSLAPAAPSNTASTDGY